MWLIRGIEDITNVLCFRGHTCAKNIIRFCLLLMLSAIRYREAVADDQQLFAAPHGLASTICAPPTTVELLLSGNDDIEGFHQNVYYDRDELLSYRKTPTSSRVTELNETTLEQALTLTRRNGTFTMILFYADWCPFSRELRPTYDVLSSVFPSIYHLAMKGTNLRSSVLWKYGVHSYPLLFLYDKASRVRYQGSRTLEDLIIFLKNATGVNPMTREKSVEMQLGNLSKVVTEAGGDKGFSPFSPSLSPGKWLQNDTCLIFATWFLVLRIVLPLLAWFSSKLKSFWNRCRVHLFAKFKFSSFFKEKSTRMSFAVELTEIKRQYFTRRWSKPLFS